MLGEYYAHSFGFCLLDIAEVTGYAAAHAQNAGLLVENVQQFVDVLAFFVADELEHGRVYVAASSPPQIPR